MRTAATAHQALAGPRQQQVNTPLLPHVQAFIQSFRAHDGLAALSWAMTKAMLCQLLASVS